MKQISTFAILLVLLFAASLNAQSLNALVLNALGENLTEVNVANGTVSPNVATAGLFTNQVRVKEGIAYVVNSGLNEVQIINTIDYSTLGTIDVGVSTNPWAIEFLSGNIAAVSLLISNEVAFVDLASRQVLNKIAVGTGPEGMVYRNGMLYVANSGFNGAGYDPGTVFVIEEATSTVIDTIDVSVNPQALAFDSQGRLVVCTTGDFAATSGAIEIVDLQQGSVVESIPAGTFITNIVVSGDDKVYAATFGSGVLVYNLNTAMYERDGSNPLPGGPGLDILPDNSVAITHFGADSLYHFAPDHTMLADWLVGDGPLSVAIFTTPVSAIGDEGSVSINFELAQNYPNPFNPTTTISYELRSSGDVRLDVLDITGAVVDVIVSETQAAGSYNIVWQASAGSGESLSSGVYFYRLTHNGSMLTRKMTLLR
ncbi:MAG: T9SS type A sorting domain-containing protein [Calditrichia bacterium]